MTVTVADVLVSRLFQELGGPVTYWFNKALGRYVNASTGRMVSEKKVLQIGEKFTQQFTRPRVQALTEKFLSGGIDLATWQERMAIELKNSYIVNMALGKGGRNNIDFSDWGRIGGRLKFEYSHLDTFAFEISNGQLSEAQIRVRAALYADGARTAYYDGRTAAMKDTEFDLERRVLGAAEHCPDCVDYAQQGWVPIGTLPEPGEGSVCNNNCQCEKEYGSSAEMDKGEMSLTFDLSENACGRQLTRADLVGSDNLGYLCRHCGWPVVWEKGAYKHGEA